MKKSTVAYRLQLAMQKKRLDGRTLAAKSGVSTAGISAYLNSRSEPTRRTAERLAAALGVSTDWLLGVTPLELETEDSGPAPETLANLYRGLTDRNKKYLLETALLLQKAQA